MSHSYTGNPATFTPAITLPDDGDAKSASSVNVPFQGLADQAAYLKNETDVIGINAIRNGTQVQMIALTGMVTGAVFEIPLLGLYTFVLGSTATTDGVFVIASTDATGKWIHNDFGLGNFSPGIALIGAAGAAPGRILASIVPNRIVALGFISSIPAFSTTSTSPVDITGYSVAMTCVAGDVLLINTSIISACGTVGDYGLVQLVAVDGGTPTVIASKQAMEVAPGLSAGEFQYTEFVRAYVVINSGTVTIKGRAQSTGTSTFSLGAGLAMPDNASIVVTQIRP